MGLSFFLNGPWTMLSLAQQLNYVVLSLYEFQMCKLNSEIVLLLILLQTAHWQRLYSDTVRWRTERNSLLESMYC